MKKNNGQVRRMTLRLYMPEVVEALDGVPAGYRSMVIEQALIRYLESEEGKYTIRVLQGRAKVGPEFSLAGRLLAFPRKPARHGVPARGSGGQEEPTVSHLERLKGDF